MTVLQHERTVVGQQQVRRAVLFHIHHAVRIFRLIRLCTVTQGRGHGGMNAWASVEARTEEHERTSGRNGSARQHSSPTCRVVQAHHGCGQLGGHVRLQQGSRQSSRKGSRSSCQLAGWCSSRPPASELPTTWRATPRHPVHTSTFVMS